MAGIRRNAIALGVPKAQVELGLCESLLGRLAERDHGLARILFRGKPRNPKPNHKQKAQGRARHSSKFWGRSVSINRKIRVQERRRASSRNRLRPHYPLVAVAVSGGRGVYLGAARTAMSFGRYAFIQRHPAWRVQESESARGLSLKHLRRVTYWNIHAQPAENTMNRVLRFGHLDIHSAQVLAGRFARIQHFRLTQPSIPAFGARRR